MYNFIMNRIMARWKGEGLITRYTLLSSIVDHGEAKALYRIWNIGDA